MFFVISKLVGFATTPSTAIFLLGLLGVVLLVFRRRRSGIALCVTSIVLTLALGLTPLANVPQAILEDRFPQPVITEPPTGVIMLGGPVDVDLSPARKTITVNDAAERVTETAVLAVRYPEARIFLSGGSGHFGDPGENTESALTKKLLVQLGIPADRIEMEEKSRTTAENARFSLETLKPKPGERWLLVTSASHMPRSVGAYRAVGFDVIPYPVDYRTYGMGRLMIFPESVADGLQLVDVAAHEWIGLVGYWLTGKSNSLFPAP
ncbi:YdcF family protein [Rhizobium sp. C4]|uniref:YdcF family protein n=1 Tax=Rhizobium sp. C4 TaxID=1349800 RepID=UPI001E4EBCEA|nr:YdcF family protein [Rhizobium sp. C4]MCD2175882.1 YdcF family protein [Rhizobium sp. C4]